jgi:hypothetical protein
MSHKPENEYLKKLKDPRWQKLRLKVMERDEFACQICYDSKSTLHIHHKYYLPDKEPWEYPLDALVTLCESCHSSEKETRFEYERMLLTILKQKGFFASDIYCIANGFLAMEPLHSPEIIATMLEWALQNKDIQRNLLTQYFEYLHKKHGKKESKANEQI